jgi:hypothetical protein
VGFRIVCHFGGGDFTFYHGQIFFIGFHTTHAIALQNKSFLVINFNRKHQFSEKRVLDYSIRDFLALSISSPVFYVWTGKGRDVWYGIRAEVLSLISSNHVFFYARNNFHLPYYSLIT